MNNEFEKKGYKVIDLNLREESAYVEVEDLIIEIFEDTKILPEFHNQGSIPPLDIYMETLSSIIHRDYTTPIVEKKIGLNLIPTFCYIRKYFQGSVLYSHVDRDACEISLSYCVSGPKWEINMGNDTLITKRGNGIIYKGCEIKHERPKPSSGEVIQIFNHWVISDGTKSKSAYDDGMHKDFYKSTNI